MVREQENYQCKLPDKWLSFMEVTILHCIAPATWKTNSKNFPLDVLGSRNERRKKNRNAAGQKRCKQWSERNAISIHISCNVLLHNCVCLFSLSLHQFQCVLFVLHRVNFFSFDFFTIFGHSYLKAKVAA